MFDEKLNVLGQSEVKMKGKGEIALGEIRD